MKNKFKLTIAKLEEWGSCYSNNQHNQVFGKRKQLTVNQVLELDIPTGDKIWVFCHDEWWTNPECTLRLIACDIVESVLHVFKRGNPEDKRLHIEIEIARKFANGEATNKELSAAWDTTRNVLATWDDWDAGVVGAVARAARSTMVANWHNLDAWDAGVAARASMVAMADNRDAGAAIAVAQLKIIKKYLGGE